MTTRTLTREAVWEALAEVPDPEIPVLSVVDLGLVHAVELDGERLRVELLPTFVGCPALELIRRSVAERLAGMAPRVEVEMTFEVPWTSERITADGRRKLRESGFAPPGDRSSGERGLSPPDQPLFATIPVRPSATCPWCGSADTTLENLFGPTLCRSVFWCNRCRQPFEQFKAV
ncbi:MAG TPA: 1,2-phenylacetyl-CoA epoxidase subunit PaaD [Actinomycetota bacterium]|nr:1,2-phenylacetyl-CoA epoxidase subunit PaaD [Actinomycetota bacterium]